MAKLGSVRGWLVLFTASVLLLSFPSFASESGLTILSVSDGASEQEYSVKLQILLLMTALSFLPAFILMATSFTRIIVVLAILRQALGLQQSPPNRVLVGIALALSLLIMRPVWTDIYHNAFQPYDNGEITLMQAFSVAEKPVRNFMLAQTQQTSLEQMLRIANEPLDTSVEDISFAVVLPAFVISELKTAFQIGFMLFIPFLIIDLVVASVLMAMGMMMLSPLIISLPFKLVVFVLVDGWAMTVGTLSASFG
ncbi:flagellar type III secretion system pore protein FliP [Vibrio brasiliensis]|jgi:flagellar biosynthetic protein FliP|uniref:Flagellar biosynthetic protein FliP n=1 Tax=Vibrio brasiliensis LMG 20546 TaxID=945543 RepID=E8LU55_9VIBR|nr:flagellar type III secretion system pore protein FliP [Vibrio brasiliensis]EGA65720.1 flagellar biosynthesis protein FliP [Vibrio brasiliensis LMG 20546]MCG9647023.1 flagellar type III secretion system pore protein FliP [Vibrio brasiliensis]MCG9725913.1 flagellar type III secretion system pore protein FliP [Vibrio brasiliensis]MCG9751408.1 flagellar type III secretion system pore protein FliP [Vibrio brasiliensis]MCG9781181.1 flagellar type III secretion system pore protein FliP [Vibrio bra